MENKLPIPLYGKGVSGNQIMNDIGSLEFYMTIMDRIER